MTLFEHLTKIDPSTDEGSGFEKPIRIEKSDMEYFRSVEDIVITEIRKELGIKNEKSKSKATKKKPKKNAPKLHAPAVANVQKKL